MKLTLAKIKTLPIGKKISDGQGLCLTKTAPNKGRWEHRYMINKRARVMALGTYPEIPLIKARQIHFEQRQLLVEGKDPLEQKHRREERQRRHATLRFSHVAEGQSAKIQIHFRGSTISVAKLNLSNSSVFKTYISFGGVDKICSIISVFIPIFFRCLKVLACPSCIL